MPAIIPIKAFEDNYIWMIQQQSHVVIIDPGDATPVIKILEDQQLTLSAILITHHHLDHIGGVEAMLNYQNTTVYAPSYGQYPFQFHPVSDQDTIFIREINARFKVLWLPGHTHDHIAYWYQHHLFCGDIIFGAGCGRIFDGTLQQQFNSLQIIKSLPKETLLYCAHEYTHKNIAFASNLEPDNPILKARANQTNALIASHQPTIPTSIKTELETNPFLRTNEMLFKDKFYNCNQDEFAIFCKIRELRNHY